MEKELGRALKEWVEVKRVSRFTLLLLNIFIVFTASCMVSAVAIWFHYHRKTVFELAARNLKEYRYFVRPFVDEKGRMISCELALREFDHRSKKWITPYNIKHFQLDRLIIAIEDIQTLIPGDANSISINMTLSHCLDYQANYFFKWITGLLDNQKLNIELDANEILDANAFKQARLKNVLAKIQALGILVTIKNIDSNKGTYEQLSQFSDMVEHYCLSAHRFNLKKTKLVKKWLKVSHQNKKVLGLTGIDSPEIDRVANDFNIKMRQGMYYTNAVPVRIMSQEKVPEV